VETKKREGLQKLIRAKEREHFSRFECRALIFAGEVEFRRTIGPGKEGQGPGCALQRPMGKGELDLKGEKRGMEISREDPMGWRV